MEGTMHALIASIVLISASLAAAPAALAQQIYQPPRTSDGHPDLQGVWTNRWMTTLERPAEAKALIASPTDAETLRTLLWKRFIAADPEAPQTSYDSLVMMPVNGELRTSLLIDPADGRIPYTEEGRAKRAAFVPNDKAALDDPEQRGVNERCLSGGNGRSPFLTAPAANIRQIIQTKDSIVFWTELVNEVRIVPLDGRAPSIYSRNGRSQGRWDGDTLVVETTSFHEGDPYRSVRLSLMVLSPKSKVSERFTRTSEDEILYRFTVEDPVIYSRPWTAETVLKKSNEQMFEFACHEGNYSLYNMLSGARVFEKRAAARKPKQ
jgi:hypothetical protein